MAILEVRALPDEILHKKALAVASVDSTVRSLMDDMVETMYARGGIGLAANQVGVLRRVIVIDVTQTEEARGEILRMANPEIMARSEARSEYEEGCLSVPGYTAKVVRPERVTVRYLDWEGEIRTLEADGLLATCIQHEIDHLDGIVFIDRISALKRNMVLRKAKKAARQAVAL